MILFTVNFRCNTSFVSQDTWTQHIFLLVDKIRLYGLFGRFYDTFTYAIKSIFFDQSNLISGYKLI